MFVIFFRCFNNQLPLKLCLSLQKLAWKCLWLKQHNRISVLFWHQITAIKTWFGRRNWRVSYTFVICTKIDKSFESSAIAENVSVMRLSSYLIFPRNCWRIYHQKLCNCSKQDNRTLIEDLNSKNDCVENRLRCVRLSISTMVVSQLFDWFVFDAQLCDRILRFRPPAFRTESKINAFAE